MRLKDIINTIDPIEEAFFTPLGLEKDRVIYTGKSLFNDLSLEELASAELAELQRVLAIIATRIKAIPSISSAPLEFIQMHLKYDLLDFITRYAPQLDPPAKFLICKKILEQLKIIHAKNLVHNDLCSLNIMIYLDRLDPDCTLYKVNLHIYRSRVAAWPDALLKRESKLEIEHAPEFNDPSTKTSKALDIYALGIIFAQLFDLTITTRLVDNHSEITPSRSGSTTLEILEFLSFVNLRLLNLDPRWRLPIDTILHELSPLFTKLCAGIPPEQHEIISLDLKHSLLGATVSSVSRAHRAFRKTGRTIREPIYARRT